MEGDLTQDLMKMGIATLFLHCDDDQIVPVGDSAVKSARLIKAGKEITIRARRTASRPRTRIRSTPTCSPSLGGRRSTWQRRLPQPLGDHLAEPAALLP